MQRPRWHSPRKPILAIPGHHTNATRSHLPLESVPRYISKFWILKFENHSATCNLQTRGGGEWLVSENSAKHLGSQFVHELGASRRTDWKTYTNFEIHVANWRCYTGISWFHTRRQVSEICSCSTELIEPGWLLWVQLEFNYLTDHTIRCGSLFFVHFS